jgi:hypothetical protein
MRERWGPGAQECPTGILELEAASSGAGIERDESADGPMKVTGSSQASHSGDSVLSEDTIVN